MVAVVRTDVLEPEGNETVADGSVGVAIGVLPQFESVLGSLNEIDVMCLVSAESGLEMQGEIVVLPYGGP